MSSAKTTFQSWMRRPYSRIVLVLLTVGVLYFGFYSPPMLGTYTNSSGNLWVRFNLIGKANYGTGELSFEAKYVVKGGYIYVDWFNTGDDSWHSEVFKRSGWNQIRYCGWPCTDSNTGTGFDEYCCCNR